MSIFSILNFAGITNVLGRNFVLHNDMQFFDKDMIFAVVFSLLAAIGYGLIYASVFELGWWYLRVQRGKEIGSENRSSSVNTVNHVVFDKHPLLFPFLLSILAALFNFFFPGNAPMGCRGGTFRPLWSWY